MSKFERYKKKGDSYYVYPHKHCQKCGQMIEEAVTYCPECYKLIQEKKKKKRFRKKKETELQKDEKKKFKEQKAQEKERSLEEKSTFKEQNSQENKD